MDCLFCKIIEGKIPSEKVYEDDKIYAFRDINPAAPIHVLVIPRKHIRDISSLEPEDKDTIGHLITSIPHIANVAGMDKGGYRVVSNNGESAGQSVFHIHFHILGGRDFAWPPG